MKKHLVIAAGLATLSTGAYASQARMTAMNQDSDGSYYMNDTRNVWRMANHVNANTNYVTTEWGDTTDLATDNKRHVAEICKWNES